MPMDLNTHNTRFQYLLQWQKALPGATTTALEAKSNIPQVISVEGDVGFKGH